MSSGTLAYHASSTPLGVILRRHPQLKALAALAALWIVYFILLVAKSRHMPASSFVDAPSLRERFNNEEQQRLILAERYLAQHPTQQEIQTYKTGVPKKLCVAILTIDRPGTRYLVQTTSSLLMTMSEQDRLDSEVLIINMDNNNGYLSGAYQRDLHAFNKFPNVKLIMKYDPAAKESTSSPSSSSSSFDHWLVKERHDLVFGMEQCLERNPQYVLLLEDDTAAAQNWMSKFLERINLLDEEVLEEDDAIRGWVFAKGYMAAQYDEWDLLDNAQDRKFFFVYSAFWGLCGVGAYLLYLYARHRNSHGDKVMYAYNSTASFSKALHKQLCSIVRHKFNGLLCAFIVANVVLAAIAPLICLGKQNVYFGRKSEGVHLTTARCCAQAHLFNNNGEENAQLLKDTFQCFKDDPFEQTRSASDTLLADCTKRVGGVIYEVIPHLFQHIGIHSSSSFKRSKQDHSNWLPHTSTYFDTSD